MYAHRGDFVVLSCQVRHDDELYITVQWSRFGSQVRSSIGKVTVSGHDLELHNVTAADHGDYVCSVATQLNANGQNLNVIQRTVQLALQGEN